MLIPGMTVHVHERMDELRKQRVEHIVGVAIKVGDDVYRLMWPCRHCHVMHMLSQTLPDWLQREPRHVQGFITDADRFLNREEAANLARNNAQTVSQRRELYSEDLW